MEDGVNQKDSIVDEPDFPPSSPRSEVVSLMDEDVDISLSTAATTPDTRPRKKRRISEPKGDLASSRTSYYLGSFLVSNAWSTVKGSGYVKSGDPILVERDALVQESAQTGKDNKKKGKGKQMTLNSMFKPQTKTAIAKKPKVNTIVRLTNMRGFGMSLAIYHLVIG